MTTNGSPLRSRSTRASRFTTGESSSRRPGLYFIGLRFLYSLSSALLGGVGRDAEHIVDHIVATRQEPRQELQAQASRP